MEKNRQELIKKFREALQRDNNKIKIMENVPMGKYTSFKTGGTAAALVDIETVEDLKTVLRTAAAENIPHIVLGNGSNMLFRDTGYDGVVIKNSISEDIVFEKSNCVLKPGDRITVDCRGTGMLLSVLSKTVMAEELTGMEFAAGIPGSLGGALFMNAGAYGGEMKDIVKSVRAVASDGSEERVFSAEEMEFGYRHSVLEDNGYIAVGATLELKKGDKEKIAATMKDLMIRRNSKQPINYPSAGSTFKRPEGYFAGKLIEDAGLKGVSVGGAQVSTLHSGFIINKDNATATDILQLITLVQNTVYDKFGVMLQPEVRIIG